MGVFGAIAIAGK